MKYTSRRSFAIFVLLFLFVFSTVFSGIDTQAGGNKKGIKLSGIKEYIFVGDSFVITPKFSSKSARKTSDGNKVTFTYKSSNSKIATVSSKGKVKGKKKGKVKITVKSNSGFKKIIKLEVKGTDKLVVLSFDDGPSQYTSRLMEAMKKNGYHGTFFMVGCYAAGRKEVVKTMVKNGNEIGIHSWKHDAYGKMSESAVVADVNKTKKLLKDYTGVTAKVVRPPYGSVGSSTNSALKKAGCSCVLWNTDIEDWKVFNASKVEKNILNRVHPGAVLVIHDSHSWSVDAIISAMPKLKKQGYELVTVSEFCRLKGISNKPGDVITGTPR